MERKVLPDLLRKFKQDAAPVQRRRLRPWSGIERSSGSFHGPVNVCAIPQGNLCDNFFSGRNVDWERFSRSAFHPFSVDIILILSNICSGGTRHEQPPPRSQRLLWICKPTYRLRQQWGSTLDLAGPKVLGFARLEFVPKSELHNARLR